MKISTINHFGIAVSMATILKEIASVQSILLQSDQQDLTEKAYQIELQIQELKKEIEKV